MKKITFIIVILMPLSIICNAQSDFRTSKWGMSIEEVKKNETAPLTNEEKSYTGTRGTTTYYNGVDLTYDNVTVSSKKASLYYHFDNGRLTKIRVVFRHDLYTNYNESMTKIVLGFKDLVLALQNKGFKFYTPIQCGSHVYDGADYNNPLNSKILSMKNTSGIGNDKLALIEEMISAKNYASAFFRMESIRSKVSVMFATQYSEFKKQAPVILEMSPNFKIEADIKKSDF